MIEECLKCVPNAHMNCIHNDHLCMLAVFLLTCNFMAVNRMVNTIFAHNFVTLLA